MKGVKKYEVDMTEQALLVQTLEELHGKRVDVLLAGGHKVAGKVGRVNASLVELDDRGLTVYAALEHIAAIIPATPSVY